MIRVEALSQEDLDRFRRSLAEQQNVGACHVSLVVAASGVGGCDSVDLGDSRSEA